MSAKDIIDTKMLKDIEYQLIKSKENKQKDNTETNKQLEKYLKNCNSIKIDINNSQNSPLFLESFYFRRLSFSN